MSDKASGIGVIDVRIINEFFDFSDVMQESACDQQVPVQVRVVLAYPVDERNDLYRMLEQPPDIGMVHRFCGRSEFESDHDIRVGKKTAA